MPFINNNNNKTTFTKKKKNKKKLPRGSGGKAQKTKEKKSVFPTLSQEEKLKERKKNGMGIRKNYKGVGGGRGKK